MGHCLSSSFQSVKYSASMLSGPDSALWRPARHQASIFQKASKHTPWDLKQPRGQTGKNCDLRYREQALGGQIIHTKVGFVFSRGFLWQQGAACSGPNNSMAFSATFMGRGILFLAHSFTFFLCLPLVLFHCWLLLRCIRIMGDGLQNGKFLIWEFPFR